MAGQSQPIRPFCGRIRQRLFGFHIRNSGNPFTLNQVGYNFSNSTPLTNLSQGTTLIGAPGSLVYTAYLQGFNNGVPVNNPNSNITDLYYVGPATAFFETNDPVGTLAELAIDYPAGINFWGGLHND